jgi:hypothetical protein
MSNAYILDLTTLEGLLADLYTAVDLSDDMRMVRANLARAYHDRTGRYFAARYHIA